MAERRRTLTTRLAAWIALIFAMSMVTFGAVVFVVATREERDEIGRAQPESAEEMAADVQSEVLIALRTPVLFVQGSRDPLCPLDALEGVRRAMSAPSALHVVEAGNHSLEIGARALRARGETQGDVDRRALEAIAEFVRGATRALRR